jgi:dTDP-4-amino-4,6-dideoxygalactose transaminase
MRPRIYLSPPHMGQEERELLLEAFDSNWIAPLGPHVDAFEREVAELVGTAGAAALSSGTAAIHLALMLLDVGPGDHVLAPTFTFSATINPIRYLGAEPVFIDSERSTWNMDPNLLEDELRESAERNALPKAVITVDLYGQCADYDAIEKLCERYEVPLVEDAAEALGAQFRNRAAGSFGQFGVFSFNGNKIITTSGGGMLVSDRTDLLERARFLASQARDDAPHYQHSEVGYNYRLSNLLAAVGRGQLQKLKARINGRRRNRDYYEKCLGDLPGISFSPLDPRGESNCWLTCIVIDDTKFGASRDGVRRHMEAENIEARPLWKPMHLQPVFEQHRYRGGRVAEMCFEQGLCLPNGTALTESDLAYVVATLKKSRG